jgi:hypothetical protein
MANDSSTGGYLAPVDAQPPPEDAALDAIFQTMVAGITGIPGSLVRPRWQPVVPKQPEANVNWCALSVSSQTMDAGPAIMHQSSYFQDVVASDGSPVTTADGSAADAVNLNGRDVMLRHEDIEVLCSFYGPNAKGFAHQLVDGLYVAQNNEQIKALDMAFTGTSDVRAAPDMVNEQWIRRYDLTLHFRRKVTRTYAVLNLLSADVDYHSDNP